MAQNFYRYFSFFLSSLATLVPITELNAESTETPLTIGGLLHLTGEAAEQGIAFQRGIMLAASELNSDTDFDTPKIKVIFEDTQYKPTYALTGAKKLNEIDQVDAILISTVTEAKSAGPYLQKVGIPSVVLWDSSPEIEKIGNYMFGIGPWAPASGEKSAEFCYSKIAAKDVVVIDTNTEWSQYVSHYFQTRFRELGGKILDVYSANPDEVNFRTIIQKALSHEPDAIYAPIDLNVVTFFQQYKQANSAIPIISSDVIVDNYISESPAAFEAVYHSMTGVSDSDEYKAMAKSYEQFFKERILHPQFVSWAYDAVMIVARASIQGASRSDIQKGLLSTTGFKGSSGVISMSIHGSAPRKVNMFRVIKGQFVQQ